MSKLIFTIKDDSLMISGKSFYIKDYLKTLGGTWNPLLNAWRLPASADSEELRKNLSSRLEAVIKKNKIEEASKRVYAASPEGQAAYALEKKLFVKECLKKKVVTGEFHWICCEECVVIDWVRQHTICDACAVDNGLFKSSFRVRGSIYTGD